MLAKRIIPCLDVTGGRVVKGVNFVELRDAGDPVEIAARYNEQGADELTFLDITATSDGRDLILPIIEAVASQVFIPLTVGGGVRTVEDVRRLLNAGADKVSFNSAAIANPRVIRDASDKYGAQCIVVAIDARRRSGDEAAARGEGWDVFSHGGRQNPRLDALAGARQIAAHRAKLCNGCVCEKLAAVRHKVLRVEAKAKQPVLVVSLTGFLQRRTLLPSDQFAVLFDRMAAKARMGLICHPSERHVELGHLRQIQGSDCDARILVVFGEVIGDRAGLSLSDNRVFRRNICQVPSIAFDIERRLFSGQPANKPGPLVFAAGPDQVRGPEVEPRIGCSF